MKLWIDDIRRPSANWIWAKSATEAIRICIDYGLENIELISLDHDLGEGMMTGYDFMTWLEERIVVHQDAYPKVKAHTMNPVGRDNIMRAVQALNRRVFGYDDPERN